MNSVSRSILAIKLTKVPLEISASHIENEIIQGLVGFENVAPRRYRES